MAGVRRRLGHIGAALRPGGTAAAQAQTDAAAQAVSSPPDPLTLFGAARPGEQPRLDLEHLEDWSAVDLIRMAMARGASDADISACVVGDDSVAALAALNTELQPPPAPTASVESITLPNTASADEVVAKLETFGIAIIEHAADEPLISLVESELHAAGAFDIDPPESGGRPGGKRMWMDALFKAPSVAHLLTNELVLATGRKLLGGSCKRIALKELSAWEVAPGSGDGKFHREDQFWPWHHEPTAWCLNMLWAIDPFTPDNGGTRVIPFSHVGKVRETGREMWDGTGYAEEDVLQASMPRGSVFLFTGGMVHSSGENRTLKGRRGVLSGYQLGWLRPEQKWWAYRPLHDMLCAGEVPSQWVGTPAEHEIPELLGHIDDRNPDAVPGEHADWAGSKNESAYLSRHHAQVEADPFAVNLSGSKGYESAGGGTGIVVTQRDRIKAQRP